MYHGLNSFWFGLPWFLFFLAPLVIVIVPVIIFLKIYSLWHAAKRGDLVWFVVLLFVNTLGILELVYVFGVMKQNFQDILKAVQKKPVEHHDHHDAHMHHHS